MRADQARNIPIDRYLDSQGHQPAKTRLGGRELWYNSPLRNGDKTPSFKVDSSKNVWYDHGLGLGGDIIDLVRHICSCDVRDALWRLERSGLHFGATGNGNHNPQEPVDRASRGNSTGEKEKNGALEMVATRPLKHPALLQYLEKRKIDPKIAEYYISEIDFKRPGSPSKYFGLAYPSGEGFEVRNALFKGFVGTGKDVAFHPGKNPALLFIFEGFIDFLSYLTAKKTKTLASSVLVLNSTTMRARALPYIQDEQIEEIRLYLDNDESGTICTEFFIENANGKKIADMRGHYRGVDDLNDWLVNKST
jgi:hypothetical protein